MYKKSEQARESDLEYYKRRYFKDLKDDYYKDKLKISDSTYRCPFCDNKDYYSLSELLRHASRIVGDSGEAVKDVAKHSALEMYIESYGDVIVGKDNLTAIISIDNDKTAVGSVSDKSVNLSIANEKSLIMNDAEGHLGNVNVEDDELFVWPWMVILKNIVTHIDPKSGKYVGKNHKKIKEELIMNGFHPLKVTALWNFRGQTAFAVVQFGREWDGFHNAMKLERSFQAEHCGKRDYLALREQERGDRLFGWMARRDDYNFNDIVGKHLREKGDLKTVSGKEAEDNRKARKLLSGLANTLKLKTEELEQTASKYDEVNVSLRKAMDQKEKMLEHFNKEISKMRQVEREYQEKVSKDHEKARLELEARRNELISREKDLQKREVDNHNEKAKLYFEKQHNEMAIEEQQKADEKMMYLAEEHKAHFSFSYYLQFLIQLHKEKEKLHKKIHDLERGLDAKQALELEIERLKGAFQVMNHIGETDIDEKKKLEAIRMELQEKEEELEGVEDLQQTLVVQERKTNDELQDARKKLIAWIGCPKTSARVIISVKRMGELDIKPFQEAAKRKISDEMNEKAVTKREFSEKVQMKAIEWCSKWDDCVKDPSWHPFKVVTDREGNSKEILDGEDKKLKSLKDEFGDEVHDAVATALKELNEYNPSGRYPIPELWNFREGRKASLKEGVSHLIKQWRLNKGKKAY
ncbi:putative XS domain-containing protein [Medicago truncatula]|uniref:Putative XS domain-containing protein n=1 Tax=Medicago truncatula TaxID=3880 RepID=A0A396JD49_MEDTR|nr:putative XS domain-containing protein [Medicago truncatula]